MRLLLLAVLCLPATSSATPQPTGGSIQRASGAARTECAPDARLRTIQRPEKPATVKRLGDEPPAALALTVYQHVGGCHTPAILREGIGYTPGHAPSGLNR